MKEVIFILLIPFFGTSLGAALVFFMKKTLNVKVQKMLLGFAGGVMVAASIWSLIIPAIEQGYYLGNLNWLPAASGILLGFIFLTLLGFINYKITKRQEECLQKNLKSRSLLVFSITLHNIPEGMAVGVAIAGAYFQNTMLSLSAAFSLAVGIAIQNILEGAIVSMPRFLNGSPKFKSFGAGGLSGVVEPIFALLAFYVTGIITPILPYILAFSAGSMLFVVVHELIPEMQAERASALATFGFCIGFILMMILDVLLA